MTHFSEELRKILGNLIGVEKDFTKCKCNYDGVFHPTQNCPLHGEEAWEKGKSIDQAISAITEFTKGIVPEKQVISKEEILSINDSDKNMVQAMKIAGEAYKRIGHNSCRTEMLRRVEEDK